MTDTRTPRTEAGRALLSSKHWALHAPLRGCVEPCSVADAILAIEAEAAADYSGLIAVARYAEREGLTIHCATRATCAQHIAAADHKATEPLTAAAFGLDVERLGQVLALVFDHQPPWWDVRAGPDDAAAARRTFAWAADRIAAEYARLAGTPEPSE